LQSIVKCSWIILVFESKLRGVGIVAIHFNACRHKDGLK